MRDIANRPKGLCEPIKKVEVTAHILCSGNRARYYGLRSAQGITVEQIPQKIPTNKNHVRGYPVDIVDTQ